MKDKAELKPEQIVDYLPHRLKFWSSDDKEVYELVSIHIQEEMLEFKEDRDPRFMEFLIIKPILHPLSDLTKEIVHNGEKFVPLDIYSDYKGYDKVVALHAKGGITAGNEWWIVQKLFEWHFDVHGLIEKNLAISVHDLDN